MICSAVVLNMHKLITMSFKNTRHGLLAYVVTVNLHYMSVFKLRRSLVTSFCVPAEWSSGPDKVSWASSAQYSIPAYLIRYISSSRQPLCSTKMTARISSMEASSGAAQAPSLKRDREGWPKARDSLGGMCLCPQLFHLRPLSTAPQQIVGSHAATLKTA